MSTFNTTSLLPNVTQGPSQAYLSKVNWYYSARFWLSFGLVGLVTNILEMISIIYQRKQKKVFGVTLLSLCIADVLGSLSFAIVGLTRILEYDGALTISILPNTSLAATWKAGHACLFFSVGTSFVHVIIVAIQRFFAVFLPIKFKTRFLYRHCVTILSLVWFALFAAGVVGFFYFEAIWYISYVLTLVVCFIMILCYTAIVLKTFLKSQSRRRLSKSKPNMINDQTQKVLSVSVGVTMAFLVCTLPHAVFYLFVADISTLVFYHTVNSMISMNPFLDSVVYFVFYDRCIRNVQKTGARQRSKKVTKKENIHLSNRVSPFLTVKNDKAKLNDSSRSVRQLVEK